MTQDTSHQYTWLAIILHWLTALTVFALFAVGFWMVDLDYYSEWYRTAPHWHKSVGLLLSGVTIFRLAYKWRANKVRPAGQGWQVLAATAAHRILYLLLLVLFVSGYLISTADGRGIDIFTWVTVPGLGELFAKQEDIAGRIHKYCAWFLMSLVAVHMLAALKHHFIDRDNTLVRMLRPEKSGLKDKH